MRSEKPQELIRQSIKQIAQFIEPAKGQKPFTRQLSDFIGIARDSNIRAQPQYIYVYISKCLFLDLVKD